MLCVITFGYDKPIWTMLQFLQKFSACSLCNGFIAFHTLRPITDPTKE